MSDTLARILSAKREEVARRRSARPLAELEQRVRSASPPRGFAAALEAAVTAGRYGLIAEIKKAFNIKIELDVLFNNPDIKTIATEIRNKIWYSQELTEESITDKIII